MKVVIVMAIAVLAFSACKTAPGARTDSGVSGTTPEVIEMSPDEAETNVAKAYSQFVDVRTPEEYSGGHAARAINIPLDELAGKLDRLEKTEPVYLICQTGNRSKQAAAILKDAGFGNVISIVGGTTAWQAAGLPMDTKAPHRVPSPTPTPE